MRRALVLALVLAGSSARAEEPRITADLDFMAGSAGVGQADGVAAPAAHVAIGRELGAVRLQGDFDIGLWTDESVPESAPRTGSLLHAGAGVRWHWLEIDDHAMRLYAEAGIGMQSISSPHLDVRRGDLSFGLGFVQQERIGDRTWIGGHTGIRVIVADGVAPATTCRGTCPGSRLPDVALLYVLGVELGR